MIDVDGSAHSGSGTIVRNAAAYAALTGQPVRVRNARAQRQRPGLRPPHLRVIQAIRDLVGGSIAGAEIGSRSFEFRPGKRRTRGPVCVGHRHGRLGTMLALSVLPVLSLRGRGAEAEIRGGLFQDFAPSAFHLRHVIVPLLAQMGLAAEIEIIRPGGTLPPGRASSGWPSRHASSRCARSCPAAARHPRGSGESRWHPTWMTGRSRPGWPPPPARSSVRRHHRRDL